MSHKDRELYNKFVKDAGDLVGKIAYSEFEKDKLEWLKDNPSATPEAISSYIDNVSQPAQIERLKGVAQGDLNKVLNALFGAELQKIHDAQKSDLTKIINNQKGDIEKIVNDSQPSFLKTVGVNFVSSLIFAVIVVLCYIILYVSGSEVLNAIGLQPSK